TPSCLSSGPTLGIRLTAVVTRSLRRILLRINEQLGMPNIVDGDDGLVFSMGRWALKSRASKYIFVLAFFLTCFAFGAALGIVLAALHLSFFLTAPVALGFWVLLARSNVLMGRGLFGSE